MKVIVFNTYKPAKLPANAQKFLKDYPARVWVQMTKEQKREIARFYATKTVTDSELNKAICVSQRKVAQLITK